MKTWKPYLALFLSFVLAFGGFVPGIVQQTQAALPEFSAQDVFYVEKSGSHPAFDGLNLNGDNIYSGGYMEIVLENPISGESLSLQTVAKAVYTKGEVSIVDNSVTAAVYLGLGDGAKYIGDVLPIHTGTKTGYRIEFPDQGRLIDNGDMENVIFAEGFNKPVGWTVNRSGQVWLNELASKTKGPSYRVTSTPLMDGSGKYRIEAADSSYSFISDFDYNASGSQTCHLLASGTCPQAGWAYEGDEVKVRSGTTFSANTSHSFGGGITFDSNALRLEFTGNIETSGEGASIGSAFGPEAYSPVFEAKAGAALAFNWSAQGGNDQYEVYGFLVNENGVTLDGSGNVTNAASGAHTELMYGRGARQDFITSFGRIPADGEYRFRFVAGSYDATDGQLLGASLFIDDIKVYEDFPDEAVLGKLGALVHYQNTASHEEWETALGGNLDRTIKVETQNINGESERTSADFTIHLEPQLVLESVTVQDAEPQFATLTFNLPVDPGLDAADFESFTIDGKAIIAIHSVVGEHVLVEVEAPVQPGAIDVRYDAGRGDISSASYEPNKLKSIGEDAPEYPDNGVTPLELVRVEVVGEAPHNVADLIFNKPVAGTGLAVGEVIPNFTVGGKPVEVVSVDGNTVRVTIGGTFEPGDKVNYDSDNGIVDKGNTNNPLTSIDSEDDTVQPITEVIEDPLKLIQIEVDNETPHLVKLTFNNPIDDASFDWAGFEINGLTPVGKISPDDNDPVVVLELPEPLGPGDFTIGYAKAEGPVGSYYNPDTNRLDNIGTANQPETIANNVVELILVRVTTDPSDPNQLKLKFNMPIETGGLTPAEAIAGLTVGPDKKPVTYIGSNDAGDEITVRLDAPYQAGEELAYEEAAGNIAAAGNMNNELGDINIATIPMVSGKLSDFGLELDGEPLGLQPGFDPNKNNGGGEGYLAVVPNEVTSVSISPNPYNTEETVTKVFLNGVEIVENAAEGWDWGNLGELQEGPNEVKVQVFDRTDETTPLEEYTIIIIRATGKLISLDPSSGVLEPTFDADAEEQVYDIRVRNSVKELNLTLTTLDPGAQIEMSINGEEAFAVENGVASENMRLREGTNSIVVTVTDSSGEVTEYTLTVIRSRNSGGGGGAPVGESRTVDVVIGGDNETEIVKVDITRTTTSNGNIHDQVTLTPEKAEEAARKAAETGESIARMVIPDPNDEVSELQVDIPVEALRILQDSGIDLEIYTDHGVIRIPRSSLEGLEEEFYFRLVPVRDPEERSEVEQRATTERLVREMAGDKSVYVVTRPMTIETNLSSRPVTLILPLRDVQLPSDAAEREQFLNELSIFIEHSDGDKDLVQGKPVRLNNGTWGLQFSITKFSTFTIVHTASDGRHESYMNGYPDGTFKPQNGLTRAELAMILDNLGATGSAEGAGYSDVAETHWAADAIKRVQAAGLMTGYQDETFRPGQALTRAEMATFAFNYLKLEKAGESRYPDVDPSHWAHGFISALAQDGWMSGYPDGTFKPTRVLTRAEAVTLVNQLFERGPLYDAPPSIWPDVSNSDWAFRDIMEASVDHAYKLRAEDGEQWVSP